MDHDEFNLCDQKQAMAALAMEREARGISLGDLEEKSGVSTNSFYAWRTGYRAPQLPLLVALAGALGGEVILRLPKREPSPEPEKGLIR